MSLAGAMPGTGAQPLPSTPHRVDAIGSAGAGARRERDGGSIPAHRRLADVRGPRRETASRGELRLGCQREHVARPDARVRPHQTGPTAVGLEVVEPTHADRSVHPDERVDGRRRCAELLLALHFVPAREDAVGRDRVEVTGVEIRIADGSAVGGIGRVEVAAGERAEVLEERAAAVGEPLGSGHLAGRIEVLGDDARLVRVDRVEGQELPRDAVVLDGGEAAEVTARAAPKPEVVEHRRRVAVQEHAALAHQHRLDAVGEEAEASLVELRRDHRAPRLERQGVDPVEEHLVTRVVGGADHVAALVERPTDQRRERTTEELGDGGRLRHELRRDPVVPVHLGVVVAAREVEVGHWVAVAVASRAGLSKDRLHVTDEGVVAGSGRRRGVVTDGRPSAIHARTDVGHEGAIGGASAGVPVADPLLKKRVAFGPEIEGAAARVRHVRLDGDQAIGERLASRARSEGLHAHHDRVPRLEERERRRVRPVDVEHVVPSHRGVVGREIEVACGRALRRREMAAGVLANTALPEHRLDALVEVGARRQITGLTADRVHAQPAHQEPADAQTSDGERARGRETGLGPGGLR